MILAKALNFFFYNTVILNTTINKKPEMFFHEEKVRSTYPAREAPSFFATNINLRRKFVTMKNTLAYNVKSVITTLNCFIIQPPQLFFNNENTLSKPARVEPFTLLLSKGRLQALLTNIRLGACTIKNYGSVIYGLRSKLVCLFVQAREYLSEPKSLAYFEIWHFPVNYESVMFYSTGPRTQ